MGRGSGAGWGEMELGCLHYLLRLDRLVVLMSSGVGIGWRMAGLCTFGVGVASWPILD